jgi:predicted Zn-dependent protease
MPDQSTRDELRSDARNLLAALSGICSDDDLRQAKDLVKRLRDASEYELMARLAEAISRRDPKDARNRRLYAQVLIDTGKATAAIDVLQVLARRLPDTDPEYAEARGLMGRAYKQIFIDARDKSGAHARDALKKAIESYRDPYERNSRNV